MSSKRFIKMSNFPNPSFDASDLENLYVAGFMKNSSGEILSNIQLDLKSLSNVLSITPVKVNLIDILSLKSTENYTVIKIGTEYIFKFNYKNGNFIQINRLGVDVPEKMIFTFDGFPLGEFIKVYIPNFPNDKFLNWCPYTDDTYNKVLIEKNSYTISDQDYLISFVRLCDPIKSTSLNVMHETKLITINNITSEF